VARKPKAPKAPAKPKEKKMRSGFERKIAAALKERGVVYEYETDKITYTIPESKHYYVPDFKLPNGIYVEGKGIFDRDSRQKMVLVIEQNPDKDIRILFMRNNKLTRTAKQTYGEWCDKRNIKWAVSSKGEVPEEWIVASPNSLVERVLAEGGS
jgi:hypothetical protein